MEIERWKKKIKSHKWFLKWAIKDLEKELNKACDPEYSLRKRGHIRSNKIAKEVREDICRLEKILEEKQNRK